MGSLLEAKQISKKFPGVQALKDIHFSCQAGVIHGLVGENGAGKSTLIKIISGALKADQGQILFKDQICDFKTPHDAITAGIRVVYQEFTLVPYLTVAENIFLGSIPMRRGMIDHKAMNQQAVAYMEKLGLDLDPGQMVKYLSVAEQQFVEIVKAISQEASLLILDEPTAALNNYQVERLMALIGEIRKTGVGIIFISHRLPEVLRICDIVSVMKDGEIVGTYPAESLNQDKLVSLMVGRELRYAFPARLEEKADTLLMEVDSLSSQAMKHPISLQLRQKEILGVYGLEGQGQREFLRTIAGLENSNGGQVKFGAKSVSIKSPRSAIKSGIVYTPADRKGEGLATSLTVIANMGMPLLVKERGFTVKSSKLIDDCRKQIQNLRIKVPSIQAPVANLSGGNQQKIVIGKWLSIHPRVLILDEPSRGVDVESKMEIYAILRQLSESNIGVIVLSSDLIELIGMCDRMLVFFEGQITGDISSEDFSEETVMTCATGINYRGVQQ